MMSPIGPPQAQEQPSGFDPGQQNPPVKFGVWGDSAAGSGVIGSSGHPGNSGPNGSVPGGAGVLGVNDENQGVGVHGSAESGTGVWGTSTSGTGVHAVSREGVGIRATGVTGLVATGTHVAGLFTGSVGIGTDTPSAALEVKATGVGIRATGETGLVATGTHVAGLFTGSVGIGTDTPSAALEIDRGGSDEVALRVRSNASTWGSGLQLCNDDVDSQFGMFAGDDNLWHFTEVTSDHDCMVIDSDGQIGVGTDNPQRLVHVQGAVHSAGTLAAFSFMDRSVADFIDNPGATGRRWEWYSINGSARLWSGTDRIMIHPDQGGGLDVARRMRVREGDDGSAGIWLNQKVGGDRAFVGMLDDKTVGFFGSGPVHWGLRMDVDSGETTIIGRLVKAGGGTFKIDHPLDPANRYLSHSFVESPGMTNLYDGTVVTDGNGEAVVVLPAYFEALNRDYRYQLTPIGELALAAVTNEIRDNSFTVRTDKPGVTVAWQVTGVRQDAWANANRKPPEEDKPEGERGRYLHPEVHHEPASKSVFACLRK
ncbi:hypothetical protein ACIBM1_43125 [Streptomyces sp. NPDC050481]|uniref:hypothetical protein n=1 Tax=Streptomyces sp. NPDC050481 TaxID=3365616 RepID=UPI0037A5CC7E